MKAIILGLCYSLLLGTSPIICNPVKENINQYLSLPSVQKYREYLRIDTSQEQNLNLAVDFIKRQANELGLPFTKFITKGGLPICIITVKGEDPSLESIMLNSHMDVVPAVAEQWMYPPFEAQVDEEGNIYARGAQDTKDIAIQYLEAIRKLRQSNVTLLRTIHVTFMPDEETGGKRGMKQFINTNEFRSMNVGFALDEGLTSDSHNVLLAMYQDRRPWQMEFTIHGKGGHSFALKDGTAVENMYKMLRLIMMYRGEQTKISISSRPLDFGAFTSVNVNILKADVAINVVPAKVIMGVDMRLSVDSKIEDVEKMVQSWMDAAGNDTEVKFIRREDISDRTAMDDSNPYWVAMDRALTNIGIKAIPAVCPATTDTMQMRNIGIPVIGFTAKTATAMRIHDKNEYLNVKTFVDGINIYYEVIRAIANVPKDTSKNTRLIV